MIEGALRRGWIASAKEAAEFWVITARAQKRNIEYLKTTLFISYEELTDHPDQIILKLIEFLPALSDISSEERFTAHNSTGADIVGLKNLNDDKIKKLTREEFEDINRVLVDNKEILSFFDYEIINL